MSLSITLKMTHQLCCWAENGRQRRRHFYQTIHIPTNKCQYFCPNKHCFSTEKRLYLCVLCSISVAHICIRRKQQIAHLDRLEVTTQLPSLNCTVDNPGLMIKELGLSGWLNTHFFTFQPSHWPSGLVTIHSESVSVEKSSEITTTTWPGRTWSTGIALGEFRTRKRKSACQFWPMKSIHAARETLSLVKVGVRFFCSPLWNSPQNFKPCVICRHDVILKQITSCWKFARAHVQLSWSW